MQIDLADRSLFGNDAGEDEDASVLVSYFVEQPAFARFLDTSRRHWLAVGRKGTGKSALLVRFAHQLRHGGGSGAPPLVVHTVPSSLVALREPPDTEDPAKLENHWKQVICAAVNMALARDIGFAWTDDQMAVVDSAEVAGFKDRNLLGALLSRVLSKAKVAGVELAHTPRPAADHEQLLRRLDREQGLQRPVWFLLDDLDARYQNTPQQQALIAAFFSACRHLVQDTQGLGIRATLRTDVWTGLSHAEDMDKVEQYRTEIKWSGKQLKALLATRILAWLRRNAPTSEMTGWSAATHADELIQLAFTPRMRWAGTPVPPDHVLRLLAGARPRWMAQLCRMAGENAAEAGRDRIAVHDVNQAMGEFGKRRLADLYKEYRHQFADLRRLVESFASRPSSYGTAALLAHIESAYVQRTPAQQIPPVDGLPFCGSLQLARFLYQCGFINGHNAAPTLEMPEYVSYDLRPDLLVADTNLDSGMQWDLQPAYRKILQTT
jgi:hypothetical protein